MAKLKRLTVTADLILDFLKDPAEFGKRNCDSVVLVSDAIPADAIAVRCDMDDRRQNVNFILHSESFEHVPENDYIPEISPVYRRES